MEIGDKVVFRRFGRVFEKFGTIIGINEERQTIAVKRLFRVYIVSLLTDYVVVYKTNKRKQR